MGGRIDHLASWGGGFLRVGCWRGGKGPLCGPVRCVMDADRTIRTIREDCFEKEWPLTGWQKDIVAMLVAPDTRIAGVSLPRGEGKTNLVARALAAVVFGEGAPERSESVIVSPGRLQSVQMFNDVIEALGAVGQPWRVVRGTAEMLVQRGRQKIEVRSAGKGRLHGGRPLVAALDEAQGFDSVGKEREIVGILETSLGKVKGSRLWSASTRSGNPSSWWHQFVEGGDDPELGHRVMSWGKHPDTEWDSLEALREAYPSWDEGWPDHRTILAELKKAKEDPSAALQYRLLRLNMGPESGKGLVATLVDADDWERCLVDSPPEVEAPAFLGIDLGQNRSLPLL